MCGIAGGYYLRGIPEEFNQNSPIDVIAHRGPDGSGTFMENNIYLGHRRLSIIDIEAGAQPIISADGRYVIIFNGEIYNYRELRETLRAQGYTFSTNSDTEVILNLYIAYGSTCVNKLNGIFAFCIYDRETQRVFIARDHLGVKPLYYCQNNEGLFWGSEMKSIFKLTKISKAVDTYALDLWLTYRHVPSPYTLLQGVQKLKPGHFLEYDGQELNTQSYWNTAPTVNKLSFKECLELYQDKLAGAVKRQMLADVPVGVMLSGGVDSAAIATLMRMNTTSEIKSFTVGFEEQGEHNELKEAADTARYMGTQHHELIFSNTEFINFFHRSFHFLEEPIATSSACAVYAICKLAKDNHIKVLLSGQGADEPLAGYSKHLAERYHNILSFIVGNPLLKGFLQRSSNEKIRRALYSMGEKDGLKRLANIYAIYTPEMKAKLLKSATGADPITIIEGWYKECKHLDPLARILYVDARNDLADDLLLLADKMSMAASVELRVPFLDIELFEFLETVPSRYKIKGLTRKYFHKKAVEKWLPHSIIHRKKKGFYTPVDIWFKNNLGTEVKELLTDPSSLSAQLFNVNYVAKIVDDHQKGTHDYKRNIFSLWALETWYQTFYKEL